LKRRFYLPKALFYKAESIGFLIILDSSDKDPKLKIQPLKI